MVKLYRANQHLQSMGFLYDRTIDGPFIVYWENGQPQLVNHYSLGKQNGYQWSYDSDGTAAYCNYYEMGTSRDEKSCPPTDSLEDFLRNELDGDFHSK